MLSVDPAAAEDRHTRASAGREVTIRPLADGMAGLWALLPADAAAAVYTRIDRTARAAPAADPRGMDARRADALVAAVLAAPQAPRLRDRRPDRRLAARAVAGPGGARCGSCGAVHGGLAGRSRGCAPTCTSPSPPPPPSG